MKRINPLLALLLCLASLTVNAQWQWLDKDGRRVFSDLPPPAEVPSKNILKQPKTKGQAQETQANTPAQPLGASAPVSAASALQASQPQSGIDKTLMERKKQAENAQAAKVREQEQRFALAQADSCARARSALAGLDAGLRVSRTNANGEREFLDGAPRVEESQRLQRIIDADCK